MQKLDANAPHTWIDAYRADGLRRALARFTRDEAAAEDIVQDAALRYVLTFRDGAAPDNPMAWMRRVATNLALGRGRRMRVAARWLDARLEDDHPSSPEAIIAARERLAIVRDTLTAMSERDRSLVLHAAEGCESERPAEVSMRSSLAARSALCRARGRLRAALDAE